MKEHNGGSFTRCGSWVVVHKPGHAMLLRWRRALVRCMENRKIVFWPHSARSSRAKATFKFETKRMNWHFIPKERKGLPLRENDAYKTIWPVRA